MTLLIRHWNPMGHEITMGPWMLEDGGWGMGDGDGDGCGAHS